MPASRFGNSYIITVFDYPHDGLLVARLLRIAGEGGQLPSLALLALVSGQQDAFDQEICRYFDANPQEWRHHALADARALQSAVHALSCKGESMTLIPLREVCFVHKGRACEHFDSSHRD